MRTRMIGLLSDEKIFEFRISIKQSESSLDILFLEHIADLLRMIQILSSLDQTRSSSLTIWGQSTSKSPRLFSRENSRSVRQSGKFLQERHSNRMELMRHLHKIKRLRILWNIIFSQIVGHHSTIISVSLSVNYGPDSRYSRRYMRKNKAKSCSRNSRIVHKGQSSTFSIKMGNWMSSNFEGKKWSRDGKSSSIHIEKRETTSPDARQFVPLIKIGNTRQNFIVSMQSLTRETLSRSPSSRLRMDRMKMRRQQQRISSRISSQRKELTSSSLEKNGSLNLRDQDPRRMLSWSQSLITIERSQSQFLLNL